MTDEEITQRLGKMMVDALNRDLPGISDLKLKQGRLRADVSETVYV
jgi:hypothetical protein